MSSNNPISDVAQGATKGTLEWTSEKIGFFIKKLKERKLAFIQERKTIELLRSYMILGNYSFIKNMLKIRNFYLL